jgi:hypothetical protein
LPVEQFPYIHEASDELLTYDDMDAYYELGIDMFVAGARSTLATAQRAQSQS